MPEPYLNERGHLVLEDEWNAFVKGLEQLPDSEGNREQILPELQKKLKNAVKKRLVEGVKVGLLFSGGIDSTLIGFILKNLGIPFTCLSVGFQDGNAKVPEDIVESERVAKELGFQQERIIFDMENIEELFKQTIEILGPQLTNVVNVGVGSVALAAIEKGKALGITHFFGGLGSEEIFAGYDRHEKALAQGGNEALHKECLQGLEAMYQRDLRRDVAIAAHEAITFHTPFLDEELVQFSLGIPPEMKINAEQTFTGKLGGDVNGEKKYKKLILREAAEAMGLSHEIAFRPKRAAQYGSRTNNALTMLRKKHGLKNKNELLAHLSVA